MKKIFLSFLFISIFVVNVFPQSKNCQNKEPSSGVRCANIVNVFKDIKVRELKGIVESPLDQPIIIQIYKISKSESKKDPYYLTGIKSSFKYIETNEKGEFCLKNVPKGYYVLKFGTSDGGWNCSWIIVQVSRKSKDRKIEVGLSIGI